MYIHDFSILSECFENPERAEGVNGSELENWLKIKKCPMGGYAKGQVVAGIFC